MKRWIIVGYLVLMPLTAEAAVTDWPVIGQVTRVGVCLIGDTGKLVGSLLAHLGAWGTELVQDVSHCAQVVTGEATDVVTDVVTLQVPTPDPTPVTEVHPEAPHESTPQ